MAMEFTVSSCIRGYHVYGTTWTAVLGEQLLCDREPTNVVDRYAVAAKKPGTGAIDGHLPKKDFQALQYVYSARRKY